MIKNCEHCQKEYESQRATSRFCSDACRTLFGRLAKQDSETKISETSVKKVSETREVGSLKFVNHLTGEEHEITEVSKRTGLNYDLKEVSALAKFTKHRCKGCGEPTWFGCAECGKNGGQC